MKIAIPTRNNQVDDHFGHCECFTVFTVEDKKIVTTEVIPSAQGCGCKSNIVNELKSKGVDVMLAGNMGQGAYNKVLLADIRVLRGCSGGVNQVVVNYLEGKISDSLNVCGTLGHNHDQQCQHS